ncbi:MAG: ABC transporter substrate-binding protein, partial [Chloroflexota bacterium]|nr:ABC transporter substrate-binding protein [Chloroflexota bacterium]
DARRLLAEALDVDPRYEPAWLWFAHIAEDPGERKFALQQAIAANPESTAREQLPLYQKVDARVPTELEEVGGPPLPPSIPPPTATADGDHPRSRRRGWSLAALALLAAIAVLAALVFLRREQPGAPLYVAIAGGMTGTGAASGQEMVQSAHLYFDRLNAEGGVHGHPVELLVFDDQNTPDLAKQIAQEIVADGRAMLVIGHSTSTASAAASPIYEAAGISAITSTSTADNVTASPWYFRSVFNNSTQGFLIAAYIQVILGQEHVTIVAGDDDFGESLANGITAAFSDEPERVSHIDFPAATDEVPQSVTETVAALQALDDPGIVVLALQADSSARLLKAMHSAGLGVPVIGGDAIGSNRFLADVAALEPATAPGEITDGIYAASPLIMDSLTSDSLRWFRAYRNAFDEDPTWRGATTYDASIAAAAAMERAGVTGSEATLPGEREAVRDALAAMNSPETAEAGLLGPIYFDASRTMPRRAVFGRATGDSYASAFEQLRPYAASASISRDEDLTSGVAIAFDDQLLERQRIVFSGINVNEIGELDTTNPSFYADFFVWFNYTGDPDATDIFFVNAVDPETALGDPLRRVANDDQTYELFRVRGRFKAPLEFRDFPFDQQQLVISFQNSNLPSSRLVYAVDPPFLDLPVAERLRSGSNATESINAIPSWEPIDFQVYQDTVGTTALLGDPEANVGASGVDFSVFTADVTITRDLAGFLLKNLLPLGLLAAITYVSLFFPHSQTGERVAFAVSAILTAAVLLASVTSFLPQIGYTVAIEWGFYAFILLSAICIIIGLAGDWLYEQGRYQELRRLDIFAHLFYPAFIAAVVLAYVYHYGVA